MKNVTTLPRNAAQSGVTSAFGIYSGEKVIPTIRARLKETDVELVIIESDLDPASHEQLDA